MHTKLLPVWVSLFLAAAGAGATAQQPGVPEPRTPATEATNMVGKAAIIKGTVAQVTRRDTIIYLNFEKKFPDHVFTAVIRKESFPEFPDVEKLSGKKVEVDGKVADFKDKPQIILTKKNQLRVVE